MVALPALLPLPALDEDIFERYCDNIAWDIVRAVDQVMEQVFDEPAEEDVAND